MRDKIRALQQAASPLEPDAQQRAGLLEHVDRYAQRFLQELVRAPAFVTPEEDGSGLTEDFLAEEGADVEQVLDLLGRHVDTPGVNPASGRFLGYIPGGGLYTAALGDYLAAVANRYAGHFFASPGAVRVENQLLAWMAGIVGYPPGHGGNLTSGGSIANLIAIVTARDTCGILNTDSRRAVVYLSVHTHHSVEKSLRIAGLARCRLRRVAVDENFRMNPRALQQAIADDRRAGLRPWLLVGSAGSTDTGSVDPLPQLAEIAREHDLWFHVDGAYGGFFVLCDEGRRILQGMEHSDSLVMDPHKTLFLPYGTGAVLVRDREKLYASHHTTAGYMQDTLDAVEEISPSDVSPELTKHFRGLRLWLSLKVAGIGAFRAALEEKLLLTRLFYAKIGAVDGFEVGPLPDLSVAIYRYLPRRGDANVFNARLVEALQNDGRIFVSSTTIDDQFMLRAAIGNFRTHLEDVDQAVDIIRETAYLLAET